MKEKLESFNNENVELVYFNEEEKIIEVSYLYQKTYEIYFKWYKKENYPVEQRYYNGAENIIDEVSRLQKCLQKLILSNKNTRLRELFGLEKIKFYDYSRIRLREFPYIKGLSPLETACVTLYADGHETKQIADILLLMNQKKAEELLYSSFRKNRLGKTNLRDFFSFNEAGILKRSLP